MVVVVHAGAAATAAMEDDGDANFDNSRGGGVPRPGFVPPSTTIPDIDGVFDANDPLAADETMRSLPGERADDRLGVLGHDDRFPSPPDAAVVTIGNASSPMAMDLACGEERMPGLVIRDASSLGGVVAAMPPFGFVMPEGLRMGTSTRVATLPPPPSPPDDDGGCEVEEDAGEGEGDGRLDFRLELNIVILFVSIASRLCCRMMRTN